MNDLLSIIDGIKLNSSATNTTLQKAWKIWNNKVQLEIMLNLGDIQVEAMRPHKTVKIVWDAIKIKYENLDKKLLLY